MLGLGFAFLTSTWGRALAGLAVVVLLLGGSYLKGRWDGASSCEARWQKLIADERLEQLHDNQAAQEESRKRIAEMNRINSELESRIHVLEQEADADPAADQPALGIDAVRRIGRVR